MKKSHSLSDDIWDFPSAEPWVGAPSVPAEDRITVEDGEPLPTALDANIVVGVAASAAKPVASIATLADYLVNGYWLDNSEIAHHWASNTITYNISALNAAEQFLAQSALQAWHDVANINFVQTSGAANITFSHSGTM